MKYRPTYSLSTDHAQPLPTSPGCTYRYAAAGSEGGHLLQVVIRGLVWHHQDGGVRIAQFVVLVDKGDTPLVGRKALATTGWIESNVEATVRITLWILILGVTMRN